MLGIGLMLVCLRAMDTRVEWKESWLKFSFWGMNSGLLIMCVGSLLPVGLAQTWASVEKGYWYARSTEFLGLPFMQTGGNGQGAHRGPEQFGPALYG